MRRVRAVLAAAALTAVVATTGGCVGGGPEPAAAAAPIVVAGGGTTGVYYSYGDRLAGELAERLGVGASVAETAGSVENLGLVATGEALLGFTAADAAADAVAGRAPFDGPLPIRSVARLYDDLVHVVVPAASDVTELGDLRGRRVSLGAVGSGTEVIARRLLAAAGVAEGELLLDPLGIDASIAALREGRLDAFFWSGGLPTPGVAELAAAVPIRLVELRPVIDEVSRAHGGVYRQAVVPAGAYGLAEPVVTMAVPNFLVTSAEADEAVIAEVTGILFDRRAAIAEGVAAAAQLNGRRAIYTGPVELHPGALRHYRERKP
ncbi:TAXI family TRAP transporter solute-binding subunit [Jiangella mangrovi]|uniref:TRAP transporter TAXI family solute receptor n=1 Tax=Jiangella mangrovi TaxID=1524084 RepID=A0A7W9GTJ7_9ACTN|nr:TAXI family TRAP transporter solute-binding subunit [Jiangella mangrovi]MBB5789782.1 TRAP transporter TAXI family solute receptor [Jiangella mangrovi]